MAIPVLDVSHLTKKYPGGFVAVDDISFHVEEGEIVGLLGPNGAGKTTTIQMLLGLTLPDSGRVSYFGKHFPENREYILSRINFASAYSQLQSRITVRQNLTIFAGLYGVKNPQARIDELLQELDIDEAANNLFWHLSSGQKTRVVLAKALLNHPQLILMDEPTASLDPDIAQKVIDLVQTLQKKERVAILYTSHDMKEVEDLCDRVVIMNKGKIVAEDTPLGLTKRIGTAVLILTFDGKKEKVEQYLKRHECTYMYPRDHVIELKLPEKKIPEILFGIGNAGVVITDIDVQKPNLEDVFLSIAGGTYEQ